MLAQIAAATFRLLGFRAGPQDFPYDPRLTAPLMLFAGLANLLVFVQVLPLPSAVAMAAAMVGGTALVTRSVLRARKVPERFNQTFNALLATSGLLTAALLPLFAQLIPGLEQIAGNPDLLKDPEALKPLMPQGVVFMMNLLNFWNFAVTAHIYRHAANVNLGVGLIIALVAAFAVLFCVAFAGAIAGALFLPPA
ncbi:MAG TPA: hypothetical protein VGE51_14115 [Fontimonas sp.]